MRRRRERGTLAALLPILVLVGLAQGVEAKHDGEKYHRRSRTRGPMERQVGVDVALLGSDVLSVELLASASSTSLSASLSAESSVSQTSSAAVTAAVASSASDPAVSSTPSTSSVSVSSSVVELSSSASSASTSDASSSASPSANLFSLNAVSPTATSIFESVSASLTASSSAVSVPSSSLTTGGYVRPNTPGEFYVQASSLFQPFCNSTTLQTPLQSSSIVQAIYSSFSSSIALLRRLDRTINLPMAEARAIPPQWNDIGRRQAPGQTGVEPAVPAVPSAPAPAPAVPSLPAPAPAVPSVQEPAPAVPSAQPPVPAAPSVQPPAPAAPSLQPPAPAAPSAQPPAPSLQPPASSAASPVSSAQPPIPSMPPPAGQTSIPAPPAVPSVPAPSQPVSGATSDPYRDDNGFSAPPRPTIAPPPIAQDTAWQFGGFPGVASSAPQQPVPSLSQPQQQLTSVVPLPPQQPSSIAPPQQPSSLAPPLPQATSNAPPVQQGTSIVPPQQLSSTAPPQQLPSITPPQQLSSVAPPQQLSSVAPSQQLSSFAPPQQLSSVAPPQQLSSVAPPQQLSSVAPSQQLSSVAPPQQLSSFVLPQQPPSVAPPQQTTSLPVPPHVSSVAPSSQPLPSVLPPAQATSIPSQLPPPNGLLTSLSGIAATSGVPSVIQQTFSISNPQLGDIASATGSTGLPTSGVLPSNPLPALSSLATSFTPILPFTGQPFPLVSSSPVQDIQNNKTNAIPVGQPSATSSPAISDQVPPAVQPSNSGVGGQIISSGPAFISAAVSSSAPSVQADADVSVASLPPTTLIGATQSVNVVVPGASEAVSSVVSVPIPAETSSPAQITAQPSFSGVSVDFKPPTTILPSASEVDPVQSVPALVLPSSSVSIAQPIITAAPAVETSASASFRQPEPSAVESAPAGISSSIRFEEPSVVVEVPSSSTAVSSIRVDAPVNPTSPPVQVSESTSVSGPTSSTAEVTFQPPAPSSSSFELEVLPTPTTSSFQVIEPSSPSHSTVHEPSPSDVVVQPSTPASESSTTSTPSRPSESSSVDSRPSSSDVNQPSPPALSDVATSSAGRPVESSSSNARPSVSSESAAPSIAVPQASSSTIQSSSTSAFIAQPTSDVASSSYSSEAWVAPSSSKSSTKEDIYVPTQTWLIMAPSASSTSSVSTITPTTTRLSQTGSSTTTQLPSTAVIPNSVPTLIVPANSAANKQYAGSGSDEDPLKDTTLISLLLAADQYPWTFVVKSADATSQLFNTFPKLVSGALQVPESDVQTYGLQVYQPASWNGDQASLLTQWLAYIPEDRFAELNAYLKAGLVSNSPLFNQTGIQGALAAQINTAFPLAANSETAPTATSTKDTDGDDTRTRDIIIGVCVGIGGLLWIGLVFWIYKRIKRNNDRAVHKRLSEPMSMFDEREREQRRFSTAPSLAPSDIDDRPSSFYASPLENDPVFRRQQRQSLDGDSGRYDGSFVGSGSGHGDRSPTYHPSVFGQSWFANPQGQQMRQTQPQNPFEDIVTRSYLNTSGSAKGLSGMAQRRSGPGRPVHKAMIGQPTLHASSLEFREQ